MNPVVTEVSDLKERVLAANREVHAKEGALYLARHPEQTHFYQKRLRRSVLDAFSRLQPGPLNILEVGCGSGYLTLELLRRGHRVTGVDLSAAMLQALESRLPEAHRLRCRLVEADVETFLEQEPGVHDAVVCSALLHHLHDYETVLAGLARRVRPGGTLLVFFEPLKRRIESVWRYRLHRILARTDEVLYRMRMRARSIELLDDDYELSDYQRRFGGIDPGRVISVLQDHDFKITRYETHCARRFAAFAWIATETLKTHNSFYLLAAKSS